MINETEFGLYLKELRGDKSLGQLEQMTGVTKSHLSKIERGERGIPKPDILKKLAGALNVNYYDLMKKAGYVQAEDEVVHQKDVSFFRLMQDLQKKGYSEETIRKIIEASEIADKRENL